MENAGILPTTIVAGETIWISAENTVQSGSDIILTDYTPADYTLAYQFAAATPITVDAVANSEATGWTLTVTAAQTLLWAPGRIRFAAYVIDKSDSDKVYAVDAGEIGVTASPLRVSEYQNILTSIDASLADYAANPNGSFTVNGVSLTYRSFSQLKELRNYIVSLISADTGKRPKRIIRTRFS